VRPHRILEACFVLALPLFGFSVGAAPPQGSADSQSSLTGTIRQAGVQALEGVTVSARAEGRTFTTTVFTDEQGRYFFPKLEAGRYRVWAQAVGFATASADVTIAGAGAVVQPLNLQPIADFSAQLSGAEWLDALPGTTREDRRMKEIFRVNCTECHSPSVALHNRFDEPGWLAILDLMEQATYVGWRGAERPAPGDYERGGGIYRDTTIAFHKRELAAWLAKVRGPNSPPLSFKVQPRPRGDAARVVITEYDLPLDRAEELAWSHGSDWSEGPASGNHGSMGMVHDLIVDNSGNAWLTQSAGNVNRTVSKLTTATGQITGFKLVGPDGTRARSSHGIGRDQKGILWFDTNGSLGRIDPATETIELFTPPRGMGSGASVTVDSDGKGKIWSGTRYGSIWFDPETKKWKHFQNATPADGFTYGMTGDADGNGWWSQFNADRVVKGDIKTGKSIEFIMQSPESNARREVSTPADRDFYDAAGALNWGGINSVPGAEAPRRLGADKNGDTVWVPNYLGMNLASINIRTHQTKYYPLPLPGHPYFVVVDKNHQVWTNLMTDDRVVKFDPKQERWTVYQLPSLGCEPRNIAVDDIRGDVWVPCCRTSRVARMQFRTERQLQALAATSSTASNTGRR
jgi:streptogramin lyase